jgi:xylan 1,4-beta-xylosidase
VDGWPVVGEVTPELPARAWPLVPGPVEAVRDDFDLGKLRPQWISVRDRPAEHCTTKERSGRLTLRAKGGSLDEPDVVFVGRRQQHLTCEVRTRIDPAEGRGAFAVRLDEEHHYEIEASAGEVRVLSRIGPVRSVVESRSVPAGPVVLGVRVSGIPLRDAFTGPDVLTLGIEEPDATFTELATLDGRYLSTEVAGGFTDRVFGMYAASGTIHFDWVDWFDYEQSAS